MAEKKISVGHYHRIAIIGCGDMIGNEWYGKYYACKTIKGRKYAIKESASSNIEDVKAFIANNEKYLEQYKIK